MTGDPHPDANPLETYKHLRDAGVDEAVAEALARSINDNIAARAVSKGDLLAIQTRLEAKIDVGHASTKAEFHKLSDKTTQREYLLMRQLTYVAGIFLILLLFVRDLFEIIASFPGFN